MLKVKVFCYCNRLATLVNTVSPLFFQNSAFALFPNPIYYFYKIVFAAVLKYELN